jgi:hypothetical protein
MATTSLQSSAKAAAAVIVERSHHLERRRIEQGPTGAEGKGRDEAPMRALQTPPKPHKLSAAGPKPHYTQDDISSSGHRHE